MQYIRAASDGMHSVKDLDGLGVQLTTDVMIELSAEGAVSTRKTAEAAHECCL